MLSPRGKCDDVWVGASSGKAPWKRSCGDQTKKTAFCLFVWLVFFSLLWLESSPVFDPEVLSVCSRGAGVPGERPAPSEGTRAAGVRAARSLSRG